MKRMIVLALVVAAAAATAAATSSGGVATLASAGKTTAACGSVPNVAPNDPKHLLAKLPRAVRSIYNGYSTKIVPSAYAAWKPKHKAPYTVGIVMDALANPSQTAQFNSLQADLKASKLVKNVIAVSAKTGGDAAGELQLYQSVIQQGADLVILQPTSPPAFVQAIAAAAKQGVATISTNSPIDSPYAVNVVPNAYVGPALALSNLLRGMGGSGNLLEVHGIPSTSVDQATFATFAKVLANCPNVKVVGEIDGNFAPPAVKAAVLGFLATHPGSIDGVVQTAVMGPPIIQSFIQAGRPVPSITDNVTSAGVLAYWAAHASSGFVAPGFAGGTNDSSNLVTRVAFRMLVGQGVKLNTIIWHQPQITKANFQKFVDPSWTIDTPGNLEEPPSTYTKDSVLDGLFNHPSIKTK